MAEYTGSFDTGVDGANVAASDPGSATQWSDRAFDANATLTYSSTQKYGRLSCQMILSATPGGSYVAWASGTLGSSLTSLWGRIYMHHSALPNTLAIPIRGFDVSTLGWQININSSGFVIVRDTAGTTRGTGTVPIATGQWIRIEFHVVNSPTAGFIEAKLFNSPDSVTPSETITSTGSFSTLTKTDLIRLGEIGAFNASRTIYMDNILVNDTGYPGPLYGTSYHSNVQGDAPALYWKLDEAAGNFANSGTLGNLFPISLFNGSYGYKEEPAVGENYSTLNGNGASMNAGMTFTDPNVWTLEAWVKPTAISPTTTKGIIETGNVGPSLRIDGGSRRLELVKSHNSSDGFSTAPITIGQWNHVVARRTGSVSMLFINGVDRTGTMANPTYAQSAQGTGFGAEWLVAPNVAVDTGTGFVGFIDEVAIYDYALTDARILAHYKAGIPSGLTADFERGTNGAAITTSDSGSANAWDALQTNGNALTYDNSHAYGSLAAKFDSTVASASSNVLTWSTALGTLTDHYGRVYLYVTANPSSTYRVCNDNVGNYPIYVNANGTLSMFDQGGAAVTTTASIALNQWVRIEFHWVNSATAGQVELRLFNSPNSIIATETLSSAANRNTLVSTTQLQFGLAAGGSSAGPIWLDNIVAGATAWVGPASLTSPQGMLPTQHGGGMGKW